MSCTIPPPAMATRPSSISNTPHIASIGLSGRLASQELFTYNLELALLSVLQHVDEHGRESVFKWRSEEQIYRNAWSTPSYWDWSSSGSYVSESSTPGASTPEAAAMDEDVSFDPPRAWTMIRDQIQSKLLPTTMEPKLLDHASPLKRKLDNDDDEYEWLHPKKKMRWDSDYSSICINELTPPSTPFSRARDFPKVFATSPNNFTLSACRHPLGEITPPNVDERKLFQNHSAQRRSRRIQCLPP